MAARLSEEQYLNLWKASIASHPGSLERVYRMRDATARIYRQFAEGVTPEAIAEIEKISLEAAKEHFRNWVVRNETERVGAQFSQYREAVRSLRSNGMTHKEIAAETGLHEIFVRRLLRA